MFPNLSKDGMQFCAGTKGNNLAFILQLQFPHDFFKSALIFVCISGKDSCSADSGGAFISRRGPGGSRSWYQLGIISHGLLECGIGYPGVYTKVSSFIDWIGRNLRP